MVDARIQKNPGAQAWEKADLRWQALVAHARSVADGFRSRPGLSHQLSAAKEVENLAADVQPRDVVVTVAAMFLLLEHEPKAFKSDQSFRVQLSRRVRALSSRNVGTWSGSPGAKPKRTLMDPSPKTAQTLGLWLSEFLGPLGLHLARLERRELAEQEKQRDEFRQALMELK
jgi:hypothetical protein